MLKDSRIRAPRLAALVLSLVALGVLAAAVAGGGEDDPDFSRIATTDQPRAEREAKRARARPQVVEALAPGQADETGDERVPEEGGGRGARAAADGPSPGVPTDDDIRRELAALRREAPISKQGARLEPNGDAVPPIDAPPEVERMVSAANIIARSPYRWGGGHGKWLDEGYDCSGSVSFVLNAGGLLDSPMASGGFMKWGAKGPGKWVTIYANEGHMFMTVAGLRFDTSGRDSRSGGSRWQGTARSASGYAVRHPPGL